ncbi:MAG: cytochrome oxidase assembly protein [Gammaproteobacteria bacterium]|nr:cytochrome oxidase assembly protein [Gammaproteobacteria bacterium]MDH4310233.1 cytochrome oxidase assembly protein [Gammaproteobacteria bacterium]MDH5273973.1 cytochrome oxidase assembly protein [Gammaproteobacteria bacterium]
MNAPVDDTRRRRGRRQLILLASLFFVPLLVAFWLYYGGSGWRPAGGTNKGDLVNPAVPLPAVALAKPDGTRTPADFLQGKWTIAYLGDGACDERCRKALYLSRQSWIALNKDMDRVQRVFLATGSSVDTQFVATEHVDLLVAIMGDDVDSKTLLATFPAFDGVAPTAAGRLYLIDPLGNLVLSYSAAAPDKALLADVKKLLRLSHIG